MVVPEVSEFYYGVGAGQGLDVSLFIKGTADVLKLEPGDSGVYAIEFPQALIILGRLAAEQKKPVFLLKCPIFSEKSKNQPIFCSNALLISKLDCRYDNVLPEESSKTKHAPDKRKEIKAWAQERNMTV